MGLIKRFIDAQRSSPAQDKLGLLSSGLGSALYQSAFGEMPPDFVDAVVDGCAHEFQVACAEVAEEKGPDGAAKLARGMIQATAEGGYIGHGAARNGLKARVDQVLAHVLAHDT